MKPAQRRRYAETGNTDEEVRNAMLAAGFSTDFLDSLDQDQLAELARVVSDLTSRAEAAEGGDFDDTPQDEEEKAAVAHCEKFSEQYQRGGIGNAEILEGFRACRKQNPGMTFQEFCAG
ncbi:MAG TPA: hypothetical protein VMG10_32825 [Gemmataceae bacterium]|nr:hypothetical protein [Gemmataceae bacterium]